MIFFFFKGSGERGEEFALMKNGAQSKEGGREGRHENVIKTSECNWCSQWKIWNVPWWGIRWHTRRPRRLCASQLHTKHLPGCPVCGLRAGAEPEPQQPPFSVLISQINSSSFWQDGRVLCTAVVPSHNALENVSVASRGTICTSALFPSETSLNYLKA